MERLRRRRLLLLSAAASHATNNFDCSSGKNQRRSLVRVVGLTDDGALVCFSELFPRLVRDIGYVSGLVKPDVRLIGIDFRVQDGALYGVGNGGGVYRLDTSNATATLVNVLTVALEGTSFGVDFNPAADRLRIVSDTGQNLRHNVIAGGTTIADLALNYTPGTNATGIVGAAYTNNDLDALRDDAVRSRHDPRPDRDSGATQQRLTEPHGQDDRRRRERRGLRYLQ